MTENKITDTADASAIILPEKGVAVTGLAVKCVGYAKLMTGSFREPLLYKKEAQFAPQHNQHTTHRARCQRQFWSVLPISAFCFNETHAFYTTFHIAKPRIL